MIAKVPHDYLISDGRNRYSVPSKLIGERVDIRTTHNMVEVFYHVAQVALHQRLLATSKSISAFAATLIFPVY